MIHLFLYIAFSIILKGYCRGDWLLKFLYRTTNASIKIAGLDAIDWKDRRLENVDLSDIVSGHLDYYKKLPEVLRKVGVQVNDNELNKTNCMMKKSKTGLPHQSHLVEIKAMNELNYRSIRMSISEPNFSERLRKEESKISVECNPRPKLAERSLSLEDLSIKSKKNKMRLSSTCADFKRISLQLKESQTNSSNSSSINSSVNNGPSVNGLATNDSSLKNNSTTNDSSVKPNNLLNSENSSNDSINRSSNDRPLNKYRFSRFNILSRFSRRNEVVEEANEDNESAKTEEDTLKSNGDIPMDNIIKDEKQKTELNNKIKNELKVEIDSKIKDQNLKNELKDNMKIDELEIMKCHSPIKKNDSELLQLNVENLNLKNGDIKRI